MSEGAREAGRLTVFLSYSRDDLNFADQLEAALQSHKYDVTIDRQGISGGEDWRARLGGLIRDADTIIFVLSPSSAGSELCKWEVEEASRLGKRIIPAPCRPLGDATVPSQLSALNYIFFYAEPRLPGSGFGTGLAQLVSALDTDLDWLREHTRLLQRASEWDSAGRTESRLLFGDSIAEAKAWAARRPKDAPEPTALHYEFVRASEEAEARRQDAERQQLEQMAETQADRAEALAQREEAQKREAEQARRVVQRTLIGMAVAIVLFLATAALAVGLVGASVEADDRSQAANTAAREAAQQTVHAQTLVARLENERGHRFEAASAALSGMVLPFRNDGGPTQRELYAELVRAYSADRFLVPPLRHADSVMAASFDPKGGLVVTASADNTARIWDAGTGEPIDQPLRHAGPVRAASFDPTGDRVVTASDDGTARIWMVHTAEPVGKTMTHTAGTRAVAFDPKGDRVVSASEDNTVRVWDAHTGEPIGEPLHEGGVRAVSFDPTGERILTASDDRTARIWNAHTGEPIAKPLQHLPTTKAMFFTNVTDARFDAKGERVVTASADGTARIWDARTGDPIGKPLQHAGVVWAAAFDLTGGRVVTASQDQTARIWDARTGEAIGKPLQHEGPVLSAAFDPTGERIVTASMDNTARIWDARTGGAIGQPLQHTGWVYAAAFDPKGERVVTASADSTARIWDVPNQRTAGPAGKAERLGQYSRPRPTKQTRRHTCSCLGDPRLRAHWEIFARFSRCLRYRLDWRSDHRCAHSRLSCRPNLGYPLRRADRKPTAS